MISDKDRVQLLNWREEILNELLDHATKLQDKRTFLHTFWAHQFNFWAVESALSQNPNFPT